MMEAKNSFIQIYPIVKIPARLQAIDKAIPILPTKPTEPKFPTKPTLHLIKPKLQQISEPKLVEEDNGTLWLSSIGGLILFFVLSNQINSERFSTLAIVSLLFAIGGFFGLIKVFSNNSEKRKKYEEDKKIYPKLIQEAKLRYEIEMKEYNQRLVVMENDYMEEINYYKKLEYSQYLNEISNWEIEVEKILEPESLMNYRRQLRRDFFCGVLKPVMNQSCLSTKKGVCENYFFVVLKKRFGNIVYQGLTLDLGFERPYMPDITIYDNANGYCIDIEIDEPYIGCNGTPIHFVENSHDERRDTFFVENGWIVIRFAEKQVSQNSNECCDVVAETINRISDGMTLPIVSNTNTLPIVKRWTKDEAHKMAFRRERNNYLSKKLLENLNNETIEVDTIITTDSILDFNEKVKSQNHDFSKNKDEDKNNSCYKQNAIYDDLPF